MIPGSSALSVDRKQQRTLNPEQSNRLNLTFIWRLNQIFVRFANLKGLRAFVERVRVLFYEEKTQKTEHKSPEK